ncbi:nuclease-related domain-containing protein [uncultured Salinicola sp.]|uniref:nuclease-related domain-containing protein n=1 Tax=uncultured Salinicola sp. TaxID=1193542 RepID=UPI002635D6BE|nr:nuclease-related domain-containing protein [uncultured Salinicola sp.]
MILKTPDEQASRDLIVLESLMKETDDRHVRDKINVEMKKIRAGLRGEQQVAFFLNQAYGKDKDVLVLHDIRLELEGGSDADPLVAQIDHVVITRRREIYLLETKGMLGGIERDENGDWFQLYGGGLYRKKLPCPIAQGMRHCRVVKEMLNGSAARYTYPVMVVMDTAAVKAKKGRDEDFQIVSADRFPDWLATRPMLSPSAYSIVEQNENTFLNDDEMLGLASRFERAHTPKLFDWRGRFNMKQPKVPTRPASKPRDPSPRSDGRKPSSSSRPTASAPTPEEAIYDRYFDKFIDTSRFEVPGGIVLIRRHSDDMRTVRAEGPDDMRRHISSLCKDAGGEWNPPGRFWLLTYEQCAEVVNRIRGRTQAPIAISDKAMGTLPKAGGESILRKVPSKHNLWEFHTDDGLVRVIRLQKDNWVLRTDFNEMNDERITAVCRAHDVGKYYPERNNWLIPHDPPELIERVCRAVKAFHHPRATARTG